MALHVPSWPTTEKDPGCDAPALAVPVLAAGSRSHPRLHFSPSCAQLSLEELPMPAPPCAERVTRFFALKAMSFHLDGHLVMGTSGHISYHEEAK